MESPQPHPPSLRTVPSSVLLEGLANSSERVHGQRFADRYRPVIAGFLRRLGLDAAEAAEQSQASVQAFSTAWRQGRYDRRPGRLSDWLFATAQDQLLAWQHLRRVAAQSLGSSRESSETDLPAQADQRRLWDAEWQDAILRQCLVEIGREVQAASYQAFRLHAVEGRPADEVATSLGMTRGAVYLVKRRILARVRDLRPAVEERF